MKKKEAELFDGESGERLGTLVDSLSKTVRKKDKPSWESLTNAVVERFFGSLNK
ncbi:MAG: hypothetical protein HRT93_07075 [Piscirickettsiaceae bacterium]|nr:hypothetical protein [Piscirickettsiaceae bacterium]